MFLPKYSRKCKVYSAESGAKTIHFSLLTDHFKLKRGFSLIELLTVISIIGILVAAATVSWTRAQMKSRDAKRKSDLKSIQQALELYFQDNGTYPASSANGEIKCTQAIAWGGNFSCDDKSYLNPLPDDPKGNVSGNIIHKYYYQTGGLPDSNVFLAYTLSAGLENSNDPEYCTPDANPNCIDQGKLPCEPASGRNYCVIQP